MLRMPASRRAAIARARRLHRWNIKVQRTGSVDKYVGTCGCVVFVGTGHAGRRAPQLAAYGGSNAERQSNSTQETSSADENVCCCDGALHRHAGFIPLLPRHTSRLCTATKRDAHACKRRRMCTTKHGVEQQQQAIAQRSSSVRLHSLAAAEDAAAKSEGAVVGDGHGLIVRVKGDDGHHLRSNTETQQTATIRIVNACQTQLQRQPPLLLSKRMTLITCATTQLAYIQAHLLQNPTPSVREPCHPPVQTDSWVRCVL